MASTTDSLNGVSVAARFVGYTRCKHDVDYNHSLLKIECAEDAKDARYYLGKKVVFITGKGDKKKEVWGKITRTHGNNGVVRARFRRNLCPKYMGSVVRVMLYPQRN